MSTTPKDVQAKLDIAVNSLKATTSTYPAMVRKYGPNWTAWPQTSNWYKALNAIAQARKEAGMLVASKLTAAFTTK